MSLSGNNSARRNPPISGSSPAPAGPLLSSAPHPQAAFAPVAPSASRGYPFPSFSVGAAPLSRPGSFHQLPAGPSGSPPPPHLNIRVSQRSLSVVNQSHPPLSGTFGKSSATEDIHPAARSAMSASGVLSPRARAISPPPAAGASPNDEDKDRDPNRNVKVVVRVRPPLPRELAEDGSYFSVVQVDAAGRSLALSELLEYLPTSTPNLGAPSPRNAPPTVYNSHRFTFDRVYDHTCDQSVIYDGTARDLVNATLQGYNATVFAYGQTGSGKTYTMEGFENEQLRGIIPRSVEQVFQYIEQTATPNARFLVRASYLQLYNEVISDLLKPDRVNLQIREDKKKGVFVEGLSEWVVRAPREVFALLKRGSSIRATAATKMNEVSSRSHAVFVIIVEQHIVYRDRAPSAAGGKSPPAADSSDPSRQIFKIGKLNLVDLAGSERVAVSGAIGARLEESKKINQSLSCLGNVIAALTEKSGKGRAHIPYRDSKLTRILEDSLGGNTFTTMMAMISPVQEAYLESLSTLKFANRAKNIRNDPKMNEDVDEKTLLRRYETELKRLRTELNDRSKNVVDKRKLIELEEQKRQAEQDKMNALMNMERLSADLLSEKEQKRRLEFRIREMSGQLLRGGQTIVNSADVANSPVFKQALQEEQQRIQQQYQAKLADLEKERETMSQQSQQTDRYRQLLLKQRDIMIQLTARLNERDQSILALTEELEWYDKQQRVMEDVLDQKTAALIQLQRQHAQGGRRDSTASDLSATLQDYRSSAQAALADALSAGRALSSSSLPSPMSTSPRSGSASARGPLSGRQLSSEATPREADETAGSPRSPGGSNLFSSLNFASSLHTASGTSPPQTLDTSAPTSANATPLPTPGGSLATTFVPLPPSLFSPEEDSDTEPLSPPAEGDSRQLQALRKSTQRFLQSVQEAQKQQQQQVPTSISSSSLSTPIKPTSAAHQKTPSTVSSSASLSAILGRSPGVFAAQRKMRGVGGPNDPPLSNPILTLSAPDDFSDGDDSARSGTTTELPKSESSDGSLLIPSPQFAQHKLSNQAGRVTAAASTKIAELMNTMELKQKREQRMLNQLESVKAEKAALESSFQSQLSKQVQDQVARRVQELQQELSKGDIGGVIALEKAKLEETYARTILSLKEQVHEKDEQLQAMRANSSTPRMVPQSPPPPGSPVPFPASPKGSIASELEIAASPDRGPDSERIKRELDEQKRLNRALQEEIKLLTFAVSNAKAESASGASTASSDTSGLSRAFEDLRLKYEAQVKDRAALQSILETKIKTLVDNVAAGLRAQPGSPVDPSGESTDTLPRVLKELDALQKLVGASLAALKSFDPDAGLSRTALGRAMSYDAGPAAPAVAPPPAIRPNAFFDYLLSPSNAANSSLSEGNPPLPQSARVPTRPPISLPTGRSATPSADPSPRSPFLVPSNLSGSSTIGHGPAKRTNTQQMFASFLSSASDYLEKTNTGRARASTTLPGPINIKSLQAQVAAGKPQSSVNLDDDAFEDLGPAGGKSFSARARVHTVTAGAPPRLGADLDNPPNSSPAAGRSSSSHLTSPLRKAI